MFVLQDIECEIKTEREKHENFLEQDVKHEIEPVHEFVANVETASQVRKNCGYFNICLHYSPRWLRW